MNAHKCPHCGEIGYTAATELYDLAKLPCGYCGKDRNLTVAGLSGTPPTRVGGADNTAPDTHESHA
jgi:hypothetical protein